MTTSVDTQRFDAEVLSADVPTLVDFWAPWCPPCRQMLPVVDALAEEADGAFRVVKVDLDQAPQLAERYQVHSIPTFIVFADGEPQRKLVGVFTKEELRRHIDEVAGGL